jgi:hypothetical protein
MFPTNNEAAHSPTGAAIVADAIIATMFMAGPNFPDPNPMPSPEPAIPPVREPSDAPGLPRSPVIDPDDPAVPNQI